MNVPLGEAWVIERFGKFSRTITEGKFYTVWLVKRTVCRCSHFPRSLEDGGKNIYTDKAVTSILLKLLDIICTRTNL